MKRILSILLALLLSGGVFSPGASAQGRQIPVNGSPADNPFADVQETDWFYDSVLWALDNSITAGISADRFGPNDPCTRGQVVTFLWRASGQPEPTATETPFSDVKTTDYFYKSVLWAVEQGITAGTGNGLFSPNAPCIRAQVATFLWRAQGQPQADNGQNPFSDVGSGDYFYHAVLWAVENGITAGTGNGLFSPNATCTRAQVVTFLYRTAAFEDTPAEPEPSVGELTIKTPKGTVVYVGETLQIEYTYTGDKSALRLVASNPYVLTVNNSGLVTAVKEGRTHVVFYHGDTLLGSVGLVVEQKPAETQPAPKAESIYTNGFTGPYFNGVSGVVGNYMTFIAVAKTSGDNQAVTATSSNSGVATVSLVSTRNDNVCTFKVSFVGTGSTTITITSEDGCASTSYTLNVKGSYSTPIGGQLTPEQFVACVNGIMAENGATINTSMGYRVLTVSEDEMTGDYARAYAEGWVREFWPNGVRSMGLAYQGVNEDGKHVFYIHR